MNPYAINFDFIISPSDIKELTFGGYLNNISGSVVLPIFYNFESIFRRPIVNVT